MASGRELRCVRDGPHVGWSGPFVRVGPTAGMDSHNAFASLADRLAARRRTHTANLEREHERAEFQLIHNHLPRLADRGVLADDRASGAVVRQEAAALESSLPDSTRTRSTRLDPEAALRDGAWDLRWVAKRVQFVCSKRNSAGPKQSFRGPHTRVSARSCRVTRGVPWPSG